MLSITPSHSTATITRSPRKPYGIHVSACVQASSAAAPSAGHTTGTSTPDGHTASSRVASHRIAMAAVPYSIGQPARAAVVTGSVNRRAGYIDWRAARSPARPKLNTARKYMNVVVRGTITTSAKRSGVSTWTACPDSRISSFIVARASR